MKRKLTQEGLDGIYPREGYVLVALDRDEDTWGDGTLVKPEVVQEAQPDASVLRFGGGPELEDLEEARAGRVRLAGRWSGIEMGVGPDGREIRIVHSDEIIARLA